MSGGASGVTLAAGAAFARGASFAASATVLGIFVEVGADAAAFGLAGIAEEFADTGGAQLPRTA